jgi:P4 family phage/plasmid primase-like protien
MRHPSYKRIRQLVAIGDAVAIPQALINRLKPFGPHFVKVGRPAPGEPKTGKNAIEKGFQNNPYEADDPILRKHLSNGGNYGVLAREGLVIVETDIKEATLAMEENVETFTVQSGGGGWRRHFYIISNAAENGVLIDPETQDNIGNIQVERKFVVGPGSRHYTGNIYKIVRDMPIAYVSKQKLERIFYKQLLWTGQRRAEHEQEAEQEAAEGALIPLKDLINLSELQRRGEEYQGSHPIHGSTTGQNFCVNTRKNVWHCFRCNSGGGGLMWLAVKHGILQCYEAQKGALRGQKFLEALQIAKDRGFDVKVPDEGISPDVARFFEENKFVPALVAKELMKETHFLTQTTKGLMYRYNPDKGIYEPDGEDYVNTETAKKIGKHYSINRRREIEAFIRASTIKEIPETSKYLLAVKNGVLDVRTRELKPFNPEFYIFNALSVKYDADAQYQSFLKYLEEVVPSETDRELLQEHAGYTLLKDNRFQKALMLAGNKQNGKSTFLYVLTEMLGKANVSSVPLQILSDSRFRFYISQLHGKMANICADLPAQPLKETDAFKKIVAGDNITGEFKFHDPFDFTPYTKLLYSANQLPSLPKDTEAFLVRWDMIEFPIQFLPGDPKRDPQLKYKLTTPEGLSGVLNWSLEGLQRLLKQNGFTRGETLEQLEDRWIVEGDSVKAFTERCTQNEIGGKTEKSTAYEAYTQFCEKHKITPKTRSRFQREFRENTKADEGVTTVDGKQARVWWHIILKEEDT